MKKNLFLSLVIFICVTVIVVLSCSKGGGSYGTPSTPNPTPSGGTGHDISIYGMSFSPSTLTVPIGTAVKWTNNDSYAHTATSNDGTTFDSGNLNGGGSYTYMANTAGTFNYHCTIHGLTMTGTLTVTP